MLDFLGSDLTGQEYEVTLRIPKNLEFQLVFKQQRTHAFSTIERGELQFLFVDTVGRALSAFKWLVVLYGLVGALKALLKISRGNRYFYALLEGGEVVHTGWINDSFCNYYRVNRGELVIGPIWSADAARGRGFGTYATQLAMNTMLQRGRGIFYIDTSNSNRPCLRLIEQCGFGYPIAAFVRA